MIGGSRRLAGQARREALRVDLLAGFKSWNFPRNGCRSISDSMSMSGWSRNETQKSRIRRGGANRRAGRSQNADTAGFASSASQHLQAS